MNKTAAQKGFTIIETLIAITILMIAITGPLVVASRGLFGASLAKDQMIASYLAQESMEVVKNIRDNNIYDNSPWLSGSTGNVSSCTQSSPCDASALGAGGSTLPSISNCIGGPCPIYMQTNGYSHTSSGGRITPFTRQFYIHAPGQNSNCAPTADECGVTVEVKWIEGGITYNVLLTSEIGTALR